MSVNRPAIRTALLSAVWLSYAVAAFADDAPKEPSAQVEVRGERKPRASRDATVAATVIEGEELQRAGASTPDVLRRVPGVEVARTGSSSDLATAAIRGATSAETPVYLAGIRLNDDVTGTADLSTLPLYVMDRVEVYRGNAPIGADRLGIGGAIFFEPRFPDRSEASVGAGIGSFGERSLYGTGSVSGRRASALVALRREAATNDYPFRDDQGRTRTRENADYTATQAWALARYDLGGGARVSTVLHAYDRDQGSPGIAALQNPFARTHARRLLGGATVRIPCAHTKDGAESCTLELVSTALAASSTLTDPLALVEVSSLVSTHADRFGEEARVTATPFDALSVAGSVGVAHDRIDVARPSIDPARAGRSSLRPALTLAFKPVEALTTTAVGSVECHGTSSGGAETGLCDEIQPGGRFGVALRLSRAFELRANAGHYGRVATLGELYGVSAVVRGNAELRPETGNTVDAGVHFASHTRHTRTDFDLFGFARTVTDLVAYRQSAPGIVTPYNVGEARILGLETAGSSSAFGFLTNTITMTLLDARDTTPSRTLANDVLPFRSRLFFSDYTELYVAPDGPKRIVDRAGVGLRVTHRSSRYADQAGLIVVPAQVTMDLEASVRAFHESVTARFAVRNVYDRREVDSVGLPIPGRSVHATLEGIFR